VLVIISNPNVNGNIGLIEDVLSPSAYRYIAVVVFVNSFIVIRQGRHSFTTERRRS